MAEENKIDNNTVSDIYEYIKCVDEKVMQNDKTLKFMSSMQSEQMKELINSKTDNLKKFFEDAIRLQTEVVRNAYEEIIENLKSNYEEEIKKIELNNLKINNQKEETLKAAYENQITSLKESMLNKFEKEKQALADKVYQDARAEFEREKQALADKVYQDARAEFEREKQALADKVYQDTKNEYEYKNQQTRELEHIEFEREKQALADKVYQDAKAEFQIIIQNTADKVYQDTKTDYEYKIEQACDLVRKECEQDKQREIGERLYEKDAWHTKNLQNKLEEQKNYFWNEMEKRCSESYENGKAEVMAWHDDIVKQKLEVQAQYFYDEIEKTKEENYKQGFEQGKKEMKAELYEEMDEAAKRNEAELKLFLDYYENKIKPFKKLINIHETTDRNIKTLQRKIKNKINKTLGRKDLMIQPDTTYEKCKAKEEQLRSQNKQETNKETDNE